MHGLSQTEESIHARAVRRHLAIFWRCGLSRQSRRSQCASGTTARGREDRLWSLPEASGQCERVDVVGESKFCVIDAGRRAVPTVDVETAPVDVTKRLTKRFEGQFSPDIVAATVRSCANRWAGARVVEFVPLLTERRSIEQLRVSTAEPDGVPPDLSADRTRVTVVASS